MSYTWFASAYDTDDVPFRLATLVQLRGARKALAEGGTEPALVGPFWRANQPLRRDGECIASNDTPGARLTVTGRVCSLDGTPIPGAMVETWQASPKGLYENQDPTQQNMNLRGRFETDHEGRFSFRSVRPAASRSICGSPMAVTSLMRASAFSASRALACTW